LFFVLHFCPLPCLFVLCLAFLSFVLPVVAEGDPFAPKLALCSTIMNVDPLQMMVWRSYNYPPHTRAPHEGSFRRKVIEACYPARMIKLM
jgi:hypothetical protein